MGYNDILVFNRAGNMITDIPEWLNDIENNGVNNRGIPVQDIYVMITRSIDENAWSVMVYDKSKYVKDTDNTPAYLGAYEYVFPQDRASRDYAILIDNVIARV